MIQARNDSNQANFEYTELLSQLDRVFLNLSIHLYDMESVLLPLILTGIWNTNTYMADSDFSKYSILLDFQLYYKYILTLQKRFRWPSG